MSQLINLADEIGYAAEIYFASRVGGQYHKIAFVLCDDYTELTSKLFLLKVNPKWSDTHDKEAAKHKAASKAVTEAYNNNLLPTPEDIARLDKGASGDRFKSYQDVLGDVRKVIEAKRKSELPKFERLYTAMCDRRKRRNSIFHSTDPLGLNVAQRNCVDAFCDLLDYGALLFKDDWTRAIEATCNLKTLHVLLQLDRASFSNGAINKKVKKILVDSPRDAATDARGGRTPKGKYIVESDEDLYVILCVIRGSHALRDKLTALLA